MRPWVALLLVPLLLAPNAAAHTQSGDAQSHLTVRRVPLAPGASSAYFVEPGMEEGPWVAGMVFVLYLQFNNASRDLHVELVLNDKDVVADWTLTGEVRHKVSAGIPVDKGPYELRFTNLADAPTSFDYYFDQNCACTYKPVPLDEGWVVFAYDLVKGHTYTVGFPLIPSWRVQGVVATRTRDASSYPDDFAVLQNVSAAGPQWLNLTVKPDKSTRHYFFMTALEGSPSTPSQVYVGLTPLLEEKKADSPGLGFVLALLGLVLVAWRRRA